MTEPVTERRQHPRTDATLVVSYHTKEHPTGYDISYSKNVSNGGMLLTTDIAFNRGTQLDLTVRLPMLPQAVECTGEVVESLELVRHVVYDTRLRFLEMELQAGASLSRLLQTPLNEGRD